MAISRLINRGPRAVKARLRSLLKEPPPSGHVLMLHNGRSGSTLLGDMLDQHPAVFWDGETIEKKLHRLHGQKGLGFEELWGEMKLADGVGEVRRRMRTRAGGRLFGSEVQDYHPLMLGSDIRTYIRQMRRLGFTRFVYLERNYIRKIVSHAVATKRETFHVGQGENPGRTRVRINPDRLYIGHRFTTLNKALRQYQQFRNEALDELRNDAVLNLSYEQDIQANPQVAAKKMCAFLDLPPHEPEIKFGKTTNRPLEDVIENFDEIASTIEQAGLKVF